MICSYLRGKKSLTKGLGLNECFFSNEKNSNWIVLKIFRKNRQKQASNTTVTERLHLVFHLITLRECNLDVLFQKRYPLVRFEPLTIFERFCGADRENFNPILAYRVLYS